MKNNKGIDLFKVDFVLLYIYRFKLQVKFVLIGLCIDGVYYTIY